MGVVALIIGIVALVIAVLALLGLSFPVFRKKKESKK